MGGRGVNVLRVGRQMLGSREDKQQSPAVADKPRDAVKICSGHSRSSKVTPFNIACIWFPITVQVRLV